MTSCEFNAVSAGVGDFVVASPTAGHATPENSNVINAKTYAYYAQSFDTATPPNVTAWEAGSGPYTVSTHTLKRATITANSNGDLLPVSFPTVPIVDVYGSPSNSLESQIPDGYIYGLTLSTGGTSSAFGVATGEATDSTGSSMLMAAGALTKTTASWAAGTGNGALDTGSIATGTWYHAHLIGGIGVPTDVLVSLSSTSPTLPTGYTLFRRLGSMKTDGASNWISFVQTGDKFEWLASVLDVNASTPTSGNQNVVTISVPTGAAVEAILTVSAGYASGGSTNLFIYTNFATAAPNIPTIISVVAGNSVTAGVRITTNTSAQILTKLFYAGATSYSIETIGWIDTRGRFV